MSSFQAESDLVLIKKLIDKLNVDYSDNIQK